MDKQLTKKEALSKIDQLIQQKMKETGKSYLEVSREILHKFQEKRNPEQKLKQNLKL